MSNSREPTRPFSIRLTAAERGNLEGRAAGLPLGTYAKSVLFAGRSPESGQPVRRVTADRAAVASALAALGASRLSSNLNQIAKAAHTGALPVTEELEADLRRACAQVADLREQFLVALGVKARDQPPPTLQQIFQRAAGARS